MSNDALAKIRALSRRLKLLIQAIGLAAIVATIYGAWRLSFDFDAFTRDIGRYLSNAPVPMTFTPLAVACLVLIVCCNGALVLGGLRAVWSLFDRYEEGELFSGRCGLLLRRAGLFALAGAISTIVSRTATMLAVTYANPPGQKMLVLALGTSELFLVLLAGLLFLLGHIMTVASAIEADYRAFV